VIGALAATQLAGRAAWAADDAADRPGKSGLTLDQMLKHTLDRQAAHREPSRATTKPPTPPRSGAAAPGGKARKPTSPAEVRLALSELLGNPAAPPSAGELAALGPRVEDQLIAIAGDVREELPLRARAVSALAHAPLPTTATRVFLTGLLRPSAPGGAPARADAGAASANAARPDAGAPPPSAGGGKGGDPGVLLLRRALVALGTIGGSRVPDTVAPLLSHPDPDVRADAAIALALTRLPKAAEHLRARLPLEPDGRVRGHIARQLNVIDTALGQPQSAAK
jgi:hypothetical protein